MAQHFDLPQDCPYQNLMPELVLDSLESLGFRVNGQFLALNSYENRVYQLGIEDAAPVVAKFYRPGRWSDEAILEEHDFCFRLAEHDIPVALPLKINQSSLHFVNGYRVAVYERKAGHAPEIDRPEALTSLGRLLGRIHAVGSTAVFKHRRRLSVETFGHEARKAVLQSGFLPEYLRESYANLTENLLQLADSHLNEFSLPTLRRIHGDFHMGNVLVNNNVYWIVDLDDCCSGPAVQDIWMLLSGEKYEQEAQLAAVIKGYNEFFDFDPFELTLIETLRTLRLIHYAAWLAKRWTDPAFPQNFPWFNTPRYWEEHINTLHEQLYTMQNSDESLRLYL